MLVVSCCPPAPRDVPSALVCPREGSDSKAVWCIFCFEALCLVKHYTLEPWATYRHHALVIGQVTALPGNFFVSTRRKCQNPRTMHRRSVSTRMSCKSCEP